MKERSPFSTMLFYDKQGDVQSFPHEEKVRDPLEMLLYVFYDPPKVAPQPVRCVSEEDRARRELEDRAVAAIQRACKSFNESVKRREAPGTKRKSAESAGPLDTSAASPNGDAKRPRTDAEPKSPMRLQRNASCKFPAF